MPVAKQEEEEERTGKPSQSVVFHSSSAVAWMVSAIMGMHMNTSWYCASLAIQVFDISADILLLLQIMPSITTWEASK